jgi:hypothetical protein
MTGDEPAGARDNHQVFFQWLLPRLNIKNASGMQTGASVALPRGAPGASCCTIPVMTGQEGVLSPTTGFRPEFLDFHRGIHVGNLEENQRITRILKLALESRYGQPFVTERWGRGVYWRWIGFLARANREAKPSSSHVSFGCGKFFLTVEPEEGLFKCGLQIERGYLRAPRGYRDWQLQPDWDWNRLAKGLRAGSPLDAEIQRLTREGFRIWAAGGDEETPPAGAARLKRLLQAAPPREWAGFQIYYPMTENEVRSSTGPDLVDSMLAVFHEVTGILNLTSDIQLTP